MREADQSTPARRRTGAHRCTGRRRVAPAGPIVGHVHRKGRGGILLAALTIHGSAWTGARQRRQVDNDGERCRLRYGRRHLL